VKKQNNLDIYLISFTKRISTPRHQKDSFIQNLFTHSFFSLSAVWVWYYRTFLFWWCVQKTNRLFLRHVIFCFTRIKRTRKK